MDIHLQNYLNYTKKPWGILFYKIVMAQLPIMKNSKILDYGSGFGLTASALAKNNEVLAIEPNEDMVNTRVADYKYEQIIGGIEELKNLNDNTFDFIICHNVLEYVNEPSEIIKEFQRVLKKDGIISVVKHNHTGKIIQQVVFGNNIDEALSLLDKNNTNTVNFGVLNYYDVNQLISNNDIKIQKVLGIRTFFGLSQNNDIKFEESWQDKMFEIETKVQDIDCYKNIAFFHHVFLKKI